MSNDVTALPHAKADYEKIRDELYEILIDAKDALKLAKGILEESEHPRAVETYSGLLKTVATINGQILDLTKTYKDIIERKSFNDPGALTDGPTNNLFVGSTSDLQRMLIDHDIIGDVDPK